MRIQNSEQAFIQAAKDIIVENGLDGLNARAIAKKAGCAIGSLYNYFQNMGDLVLQINAETLLELKKEMQKAVAEKTKKKLSRLISRSLP
jgi:AcrR family transcriptional regulator